MWRFDPVYLWLLWPVAVAGLLAWAGMDLLCRLTRREPK